MSRRLLALVIVAIAIVATGSCTRPLFSEYDDAHTWGTYNTCLKRVRDTCHRPGIGDGGCWSTESASATISIALASDQKKFLLARPPLSTVEGEQNGLRFETSHEVTAASGLSRFVCGCEVNVKETIRGELVSTAPERSACASADAGTSDGGVESCSPIDLDSPDGGASADWLSSEHETIDLEQRFSGIQGTIVNEVTPVIGKTCGCAPCVIEYEFTGVQ